MNNDTAYAVKRTRPCFSQPTRPLFIMPPTLPVPATAPRNAALPHILPVFAALLVLALGFSACSGADAEAPGAGKYADETFSSDISPDDWRPLFDGETLDGWIGLGRDAVPEGHWQVVEGTIRKVASGNVPVAEDGQPLVGGDLMTTDTFGDFEFAFEWKVAEGANSGVKYNVSEELSTSHLPRYAALGFEYQVLDDERHPDGALPSHQSGALYDMIPAGDAKVLKPVGEWNESRIVFSGMHGEHWLNGVMVVEYDMDSPRFDSLLAASKYADIEGFADRRVGHIVLQDHGDDVWFRNLRIQEPGQ